MPGLDAVSFLSPSAMAGVTELTVTSLANPTELNSIGVAVPDWRLCRTVAAGTDDATWYRLDASTGSVNAPYVMASVTAGLRWVAVAGRYSNQAITTPATMTAKPTGTAGIQLDPNAATGDFTLSLSPANITAARRWSFPDRTDTVAGLGAQTFTGNQTIDTTTQTPLVLNTTNASGQYLFLTRSSGNGVFFGHYSAASGGGVTLNADAGFFRAAQGIGFGASSGTVDMALSTAGVLSIISGTDATSTTAAAVVVTGGIAAGKRICLDGGTGKTIKYSNGTANAAVAVTFGAVGPTGSTAGNQQGWLRVDIAGTDRYIPYW